MVERRKRNSYRKHYTNQYFWRTYDQKEIDLVEEDGGKLHGAEFQWTKKNIKSPKLWLSTYEEATYKEINRVNYLDFICG